MFEEIIRKEVEREKKEMEFCNQMLNSAISEFSILFWSDEIKKHEYAVDTLNGVLNLVSLT